jgi:chromosome segregation ATPase
MATTPNSNPGSNPNQLNEKDLKRLIELLQTIDKLSELAATNMANQAQSAGNARQQLDRLEGEWNDITGDIGYASKGFKEILEAIKNTNEGINESAKVYKTFSSIAEQIQRYQRDISEMSEKDVDKLKEKVQAQKLSLETANELLKDNKTDIEGEQKTLDLLRAQNELAQKNYQTIIDSLKQKEKTHGLSKVEEKNLEKFTESLKETKHEYTSINSQIKDNNTSLTQIEDTLIQNNAVLKGFDGLVEGIELTLQRLSKEVRFENVENLDKQFKNIIKEAQSTDENLSKITKSFTSISSIAEKVQGHQSGANELSEKDAKKLLEKLESERRRLSNSYELLKLEEQRLKVSKKSNQENLDNTKQEIDALEAKSILTKDEEEKLKTFKVEYQKQLETKNKINEDLEVNKATQEKTSEYVNKQNTAYNTTVDNLEKIKKQQENIRKSLGLSGLAVDGIGKAFSKLGMGGLSSAMGLDEAKEKMKEVADEITNGGEKAAGLVGKFKILGAGLSVIGKNIFSYLTDPLTIVTGLVAGAGS